MGKLYLVATPIGNLEDVSLRALRILQEVHMVACEDTRHTQILLRRYDIVAKHLTSYTEFNHKRKVAELAARYALAAPKGEVTIVFAVEAARG